MESLEIEKTLKEGMLVVLTRHLDMWYKQLTSEFNVQIANRLGKIVKIIDWDTDEGKIILKAREETGKWNNLDSKSFKYVVKIFYPELVIKSSNKVMIEEVLPLRFPGTEALFFFPVPKWMSTELVKNAKKQTFSVVEKNAGAITEESQKKIKPIIKKSVTKKKVVKKVSRSRKKS